MIIQLLRGKDKTKNCDPIKSIYSSAHDKDLARIQPGKTIISKFSGRIQEIIDISGFPKDHADILIIPAIENYASYIQEIEINRIALKPEKLTQIELTVQNIINALKLRRGIVLPPDCRSETSGMQRHKWTYGLFISMLMQNFYVIADQRVEVFDVHGNHIKDWNPLHEPMTAIHRAYAYSYYHDPINYQKVQETFSTMILPKIIDTHGMQWLSSDHALLEAVLKAIGIPEISGHFADVIKKLKFQNIKNKEVKVVSAEHTKVAILDDYTEPQHVIKSTSKVNTKHVTNDTNKERQNSSEIISWIKNQIIENQLTINTPTAPIHRVAEGVLLVSPKIFIKYSSDKGVADWKSVQRKFQKMKIHRKSACSSNIIEYNFILTGKSTKVSGFLIENPAAVLPAEAIFPINELLIRETTL